MYREHKSNVLVSFSIRDLNKPVSSNRAVSCCTCIHAASRCQRLRSMTDAGHELHSGRGYGLRLTHWAGHLASNSRWCFSQADVWPWWTSRHVQSWSLAPQHALRSLASGALISPSPQSVCRVVNNRNVNTINTITVFTC